MQAGRFPLASLFFALVVFPHHLSCLTQIIYIKLLYERVFYSIRNLLFHSPAVILSGTVHFREPEGTHWTVLKKRGS